MYVIKANAYGFGAKKLIQYLPLETIDYFGVSRIAEATEIAKELQKPILLLKNTFINELKEGIVFPNIEYTISDLKSLEEIDKWCTDEEQNIAVHLKVNTGMNRLGLQSKELAKAIKTIQSSLFISLRGIYTHFANADDLSSPLTELQNERFQSIIMQFKPKLKDVLFHAANSAATLALPETHHDMVRCGLICYGIFPPMLEHLEVDLKEAIEIRTKIIQILELNEGEGVGYGQSYFTKEKTRIASIAIGYADGINRSLSNKGFVSINNTLCPMIGNISMDQTSVLIGDLDVNIEDDVYLVSATKSQQLTTNQLAKLCDTLPYELLISIGGRVDRSYVS
jgi:alanine racemase